MMLGYLLARTGVDVLVLEKHGDFLRDYRGDTIHPTTLEVMHELGILDEFLKRPHQELRELSGQVGSEKVIIGDFTHLPTHCNFVALMPQWDFLDFIKAHAQRYPTFRLMMNAEVTGVIDENGTIAGVRGNCNSAPFEVRAELTVGADGRRSVVRQQAGLRVIDLGAPMDVLWMRFSRHPDDPGQTFGHADAGKIFIMIDREEYWQCALAIPKGAGDEVRRKGIEAFRAEIAAFEPLLADRVHELRDWNDDISLLTVAVDRLEKWSRPGLLCIGDAAHAMSPIGGIGINLAIQDAVAAANILGPILRERTPTPQELQRVQERRNFPTRATQKVQVLVQNRVIRKVLGSSKSLSLPWALRLLQHWKYLRRLPARLVGIGFRPEHVHTPETTVPATHELVEKV